MTARVRRPRYTGPGYQHPQWFAERIDPARVLPEHERAAAVLAALQRHRVQLQALADLHADQPDETHAEHVAAVWAAASRIAYAVRDAVHDDLCEGLAEAVPVDLDAVLGAPTPCKPRTPCRPIGDHDQHVDRGEPGWTGFTGGRHAPNPVRSGETRRGSSRSARRGGPSLDTGSDGPGR